MSASVPMQGLIVERLAAVSGGFAIHIDRIEVRPGELVCVMGKSGAGKTTLLDAIAGFLPLKSGSIRLRGSEMTALAPEKRGLARVFQRGALFPHLSARANVEFALRARGVPAEERSRRAREWLARLGIAELEARFPHEISGGEAQRVALARALIAGFPALLLDEPFSALDPGTRAQLRHVVRSLVTETGVAALLVTHDVDDAAAMADRVLVLRAGRLAWEGPLAMFLAERPSL